MLNNAHVAQFFEEKLHHSFMTMDEAEYLKWGSLLLKENLSMDTLEEYAEREKEYIPF